MQSDHSQRAAGCCGHNGEFFQPPDWDSAGVRDEPPHTNEEHVWWMTRLETKHTVGALETHQGHQSRAGFRFFFSLASPFQSTENVRLWPNVQACFNLHSTASLFSKKYVSPAPYQKKGLPILPLCILDTQVLVLAVDRWKNSPTPCLTMTYLLFSTRVWIWSAGKVSSSCCKSAWLEPGGKHS